VIIKFSQRSGTTTTIARAAQDGQGCVLVALLILYGRLWSCGALLLVSFPPCSPSSSSTHSLTPTHRPPSTTQVVPRALSSSTTGKESYTERQARTGMSCCFVAVYAACFPPHQNFLLHSSLPPSSTHNRPPRLPPRDHLQIPHWRLDLYRYARDWGSTNRRPDWHLVACVGGGRRPLPHEQLG